MLPQSSTLPTLIPCACGCGELRPTRDPQGKRRYYIFGHQSRPSKGKKLSAEKCRRIREGILRSYREGTRINPTGTAHWRFKGRQSQGKLGYFTVTAPDHPAADSKGHVYEHRIVMESLLGRYLHPGEVVHHIDENPSNNSPDNLRLFPSYRAHRQFHADWDRQCRAAVGLLKTALLRLEWIPLNDTLICPTCQNPKPIGHTIRCQTAKALGAAFSLEDSDKAADAIEEAMR
jgi:hypothetical protein